MSLRISLSFAVFVTSALIGACDAKPAGSACEALEDEAIADATSTSIELRNVGAAPIFLGESGDRHDLVSFSVDGVPLVDDLGFPELACATVEDALEMLCAEEPLPKDSDRVVRIDPGASFTFTWDGYLWEHVEIEACWREAPCEFGEGYTCNAGRLVELGAALSMRVSPAATCARADSSECLCPEGESACEIDIPVFAGDGQLSDTLPVATLEQAYDGSPIVIEIGG